MHQKVVRCLFVFLTAGAVGTQSGCYGSFAATRSILDWNGQVTDNKYIHSLLFWAFIIVPVYELTLLGDALIFNIIEFWSGTNPIQRNQDNLDTISAMADGSVVFRGSKHSYRFVPRGQGAAVYVDDAFVGSLAKHEGGIIYSDVAHGAQTVLTADDVSRLAEVYAGRTSIH